MRPAGTDPFPPQDTATQQARSRGQTQVPAPFSFSALASWVVFSSHIIHIHNKEVHGRRRGGVKKKITITNKKRPIPPPGVQSEPRGEGLAGRSPTPTPPGHGATSWRSPRHQRKRCGANPKPCTATKGPSRPGSIAGAPALKLARRMTRPRENTARPGRTRGVARPPSPAPSARPPARRLPAKQRPAPLPTCFARARGGGSGGSGGGGGSGDELRAEARGHGTGGWAGARRAGTRPARRVAPTGMWGAGWGASGAASREEAPPPPR